MDKSTAYDTLGLPQGAGEEEVKRAYKELAQKYNADNYDAGPLRTEAEEKMNQINDAFDVLMSYLRTGAEPSASAPSPGYGYADQRGTTRPSSAQYQAIRQLINSGQVDEALAQLSSMPEGPNDAEWNFLMGSAYYYKGWLDQAMGYFQQAVRLDPSNREYEAALRNLQNSAGGNMNGNPYGGQSNDAQALNCACNTCSMMLCMDACCSVCRVC